MNLIQKVLSFLLSAVVALCLFSFGASALIGDVNSDGNVDMKDVLRLRKYIAKIGDIEDEAAADMNADGSIDMKDVLRLRQVIAHYSLPDPASDPASEPALEEPDEITAIVLAIVNDERESAGLSPLLYSANLQRAAQIRAEELDRSFSQTRPGGGSWSSVLDECRVAYSAAAESIALGYPSADALIESFLSSDGYRAMLLDPDYTHLAVGFDPQQNAWSLLLIKSATYVDPSEVNVSDTIARVIEIVNEERVAAGVAPLSYNASLQMAADTRAKEISESFSHTRPDGTPCFTAIDAVGIRYASAGENIALGQRSPEDVMNAWMNSEGHRKNILDTRFTQIAVGYDPQTNAWVQLFMSPAQ